MSLCSITHLLHYILLVYLSLYNMRSSFMIVFHGRLALYIYRCIFPYKWKREGRSLCNLTVLMDICHVRLNAQSYNTERKVQEVRLYIFKNDQMYHF